MRFWILAFVGSSIDLTSTKYCALGNPNNKDITSRRLGVEPVNTEEITGGLEVFVKAIGAQPQDVAAFTKATAHSATEIEKTISDKKAELIEQTLWKEFQQQKWLPEFDRLNRADLMPIFMAFVQEHPDRTRMFEEWSKWRDHKELAQGTAVLKSASVDTTTKTEHLLPDETAELVWPTFWNKFKQQMQLLQLPSFDRLDPILQAYLKPKLLAFIHEDENMAYLFNEWIKWKKHKASDDGALAPDSFSAFLASTVHETVADEKVISDETAEGIMTILWNEFHPKNVPESGRKRFIENFDLVSTNALRPKFLKFVYEDGNRRKIYEEWLKWQNHPGRKKAMSQDSPAFKRAKRAMTHIPPMPVAKNDDIEAGLIWKTLWTEFQEKHVVISDRKPSFEYLDLAAQYRVKPKFLKFVYEDGDRAKMFEKWLARNEAWAQDVAAFKHAMAHPSISDKEAERIWQTLWDEFKVKKRIRKESFAVPPAFGQFIESQKSIFKSSFLAFVNERNHETRRSMFEKLLAWQKSRKKAGKNVLY